MNLLSMNVGEQRDFKVGLVTYTAERTSEINWQLHSTVDSWKTADVSHVEATLLKYRLIRHEQLNWQ